MTNLSFVFLGENFAVINKPAGLVVNRAVTVKGMALADYLEDRHFLPARYRQEAVFWRRQGIVHRLDKDASGLLLLARNPDKFAFLQQQFCRRRVVKKYWALVWGELPAAGKITFPLAKMPLQRRYPIAVSSQGKEAVTLFWRQKMWRQGRRALTLVKVRILTGRTHQIRAHFRYLGFPLWGDKIYGRKSREEEKIIGGYSRLFLHAYYLKLLVDDKRKKTLKIGLPRELQEVILLLDQKWQHTNGGGQPER